MICFIIKNVMNSKRFINDICFIAHSCAKIRLLITQVIVQHYDKKMLNTESIITIFCFKKLTNLFGEFAMGLL